MRVEYGFDKLIELRKIAEILAIDTDYNYTEVAKLFRIDTKAINDWARKWFNVTGSQLAKAIVKKQLPPNRFPMVVGFKVIDPEYLPKVELERNNILDNNVMVILHYNNKLEYVSGVYKRGVYRKAVRFTNDDIKKKSVTTQGIYKTNIVRDTGMAEALAIQATLELICQSR